MIWEKIVEIFHQPGSCFKWIQLPVWKTWKKNVYHPSTLAGWTQVGIQPTEMKVAVTAPSEWFIKGIAKVKFNPKMPSFWWRFFLEVMFGFQRFPIKPKWIHLFTCLSNSIKSKIYTVYIYIHYLYICTYYIFPKEETYDPDKCLVLRRYAITNCKQKQTFWEWQWRIILTEFGPFYPLAQRGSIL